MARQRRAALEHVVNMGATDLTARLEAGQLGHAYGREDEIGRVLRGIQARRSVLLLGPSDVGKTAILHEAVRRMARGQGPEPLHGKRVVAISTGRILTGTRYIGEWQTRLTELLEAVKDDHNLLLYVEDIWALRDAGRASEDADGFNVQMRPYIENQDLVLLGESTHENYVSGPHRPLGLADDQGFMRHFDVVKVEEPSLDETRAILQAAARHLQRAHHVRIEAAAIERGLELTRQFLPYQAFPGKAIRLLDTAAGDREAPGPDDATRRPADARPVAATTSRDQIVTADVVTAAFSRMTGVPEPIISDKIPLTQEAIRAYFEERIIGQAEGIDAVVDVVTLVKAQLHDTGRPLGVLFFVGPTGVGKTELAKTLAEYLFGGKEKLLRFDMSEYKTVLSLKDFLEQLTEKQRRQSFSVILLDEFEKAGSFVFDLFLQVFDDARLTDPAGRSVDLHNTIIIMTSNLGTDQAGAGSLGFVTGSGALAEERSRLMEAVEDYFRPEFINRLDRIVTFRPLGVAEMRTIARRELGKALLREGVLRRNILLDFREEVLDVLLQVGFSPIYGARPLQRAIRDRVLLPLARQIAARPAAGEQLFELCARDGNIVAEVIPMGPLAEAARPETEPASAPLAPTAETGASGDGVAARPRETRPRDGRPVDGRIGDLCARLESILVSDRFQEVDTRAHELVEQTAQPAFWDDHERSREVLAAAYHLDRVKERLNDLRNRAERLAERAKMVRRHGDAAGMRDLAARCEALEGDVALAELELAGAVGDEVGAEAVFVCVGGVTGPRVREAGDWPTTLAAMYTAWARRKGFEVADVADEGGAPIVLIKGPGIGRILRGETGIHKAQHPPAEDGRGHGRDGRRHTEVRLARVEVLPSARAAGGETADDAGATQVTHLAVVRDGRDSHDGHSRDGHGREHPDHPVMLAEVTDGATGLRVRVRATEAETVGRALLAARRECPPRAGVLDGTDVIARVYNLVRTQYVRDPRTGQRDGRPREVLGGALDPFLLAYLRQEEEHRAEAPSEPERQDERLTADDADSDASDEDLVARIFDDFVDLDG